MVRNPDIINRHIGSKWMLGLSLSKSFHVNSHVLYKELAKLSLLVSRYFHGELAVIRLWAGKNFIQKRNKLFFKFPENCIDLILCHASFIIIDKSIIGLHIRRNIFLIFFNCFDSLLKWLFV